MPAFLGLRGTGDFTTDERPQNWREMILFLNPNGEAPLTGMLSLLAMEGTDDPQFNWWEKRLPAQRLFVTVQALAAATTITVAANAKDCVKGTILMHESSGELLRVTTDPTTDTSLTVERSWGILVNAGTIPASVDNTDAGTVVTSWLTVIANVNEEGALPPTAKAYSPVKQFNYTEIFRMSLYMTRTARKTKMRWDNKGPYREAKREALALHSIEMEKAHIFGDAQESTGTGGKPMRSTKGVINFLASNIGSASTNLSKIEYGTPTAPLGLITEEQLDTICEGVFRYGKNEKLMLCGSTVTKAMTSLGKRNGFLQMLPTSQTYGMKIIEYISAAGTLYIKTHPLFNQHRVWRQNALILDVDNLVSRPLDDTMFIRNRQQPGEDAAKDEFLTETGLEVHFEETHAYLQGVQGSTAT